MGSTLLDRFVNYTGAIDVLVDVVGLEVIEQDSELTALSLGPYTQAYTVTMDFESGVVTQSLENELRPTDQWVAPVRYDGQAVAAILVGKCEGCQWSLYSFHDKSLVQVRREMPAFTSGLRRARPQRWRLRSIDLRLLGFYRQPVLALGLADFEPSDRLLTNWGEGFFRVRGLSVLALEPQGLVV